MGPKVPVDTQLLLCGRSDSWRLALVILQSLKSLAVEYLWFAENSKPSSKIGISPDVMDREAVKQGDGRTNVERARRAEEDGGKREAE
jgi:hypothetical protein